MSGSLDSPLPPELRSALENLAAGLFGLDAWIAERDKFVPPEPDLPWRRPGHVFSPVDIGAMPFFENLLRASSGDDDLNQRWASLSADPLKFSPLSDPRAWRAHRGLADAAKFGAVQSGNILLSDTNSGPISRASFYAACWPTFAAVVKARAPAAPADWAALATELLNNRNSQWPNSNRPASAAFVTQFCSDMLVAMLNMQSPVASPWREALLIELGEHRRVGNCYTPQDARQTVTAFRSLVGP